MKKPLHKLKKSVETLYREVFNKNLVCPPCAIGYHSECYELSIETGLCCCFIKTSPVDMEAVEGEIKSRGGQVKGAESIRDTQSTGRKRAAKLYPIMPEDICEWKELLSAGGGVVPIIGCLNNKATDLHHGPDKNTLNNERSNIHKICSWCHNRWHSKNDEFYGKRPPGTEPFIPLDDHKWVAHDPETKATSRQLIEAQLERKKRKA